MFIVLTVACVILVTSHAHVLSRSFSVYKLYSYNFLRNKTPDQIQLLLDIIKYQSKMNIKTETYGSLLPFLVVEAISSQKQSFESMSVRLMDKGWAWLVSGRKLLVWRFKDDPTKVKTRRMLSPCFELPLPQSDVSHRANLIQVFFIPQNPNTSMRAVTVPSAFVVSPEGVIRFWSSVASEQYTEMTVAEVQGQEFCILAPISAYEYLLGTTTGLIFLLTIGFDSHDPKKILICSPLTEPASLISGFSRRMTNLFFGPMTNEITETRRPLFAVPKYSQSTIEKSGSTDRPFFILSSTLRLRQWARTNQGVHSVNQLIREWDLHKNIQLGLVSGLELNDASNLSFWPVDMITTKSKELLILLVTLNSARDNTVNYATCIFNPYQAGDRLSSVTILGSHTWRYSNESEDQLLSLRFLERIVSPSTPCFLYDRKFLYLVQVNDDILDALDYGNQNDSILGAGFIEGAPILFTQRDGLIYVKPVVNMNKSRLNDTSIQIDAAMPGTSIRDESMNRSRHNMTQQSMASRVEPMVVELDEEDDANNENNDKPTATPIGVNAHNNNQSMFNKSTQPLADESMHNRSGFTDRQSNRKVDELADVLKENKDFQWIQQIDSKQYLLASETLKQLAESSETLADRRETLLALSKLAQLAE